jgi:hypothetical protein
MNGLPSLGHTRVPFGGLRPDHRIGIELTAIDAHRAAEAAADLERRFDDRVARQARQDGLEIRDFPGRAAADHSVILLVGSGAGCRSKVYMGAKRPACSHATRPLQHERLQAMQFLVLNVWRSSACNFSRVIPEIDIWRAANLMLKRYGDEALEESAARADELAAQEDHNGAVVWRRITAAVGQLANQTPSGPLH